MWTKEHLDGLKKSGKIRGYSLAGAVKGKEGKAKYSNEKTDVEGKTFDSKKEAKRYKELNLLLKAGAIGMLARQVEFELNVGGTHSLKYVADFTYIDSITGQQVVEDVKGMRTVVYRKKKKLMKKVHGITIKEI